MIKTLGDKAVRTNENTTNPVALGPSHEGSTAIQVIGVFVRYAPMVAQPSPRVSRLIGRGPL
jgi:hypothetical protein